MRSVSNKQKQHNKVFRALAMQGVEHDTLVSNHNKKTRGSNFTPKKKKRKKR